MVIGFTGTRDISKVSVERQTQLASQIEDIWADNSFKIVAIHGGAIGADTLFHELCMDINIPIHCRPAYVETDLYGCDVEYIPEPPLVRNKKIVDDCDILIALPIDPDVEEARSGTWATIRYARKSNKQIIII